MRNQQKKTLSDWLTSRFLLIIRDEINFEERATFRFNYARLFLGFSLISALIFTICFVLITTILARWFDPRFSEGQQLKMILAMEDSVERLTQQVRRAELYRQNISNILKGKIEIGNPEALPDSSEQVEADLDNNHPVDSMMRKEFEESGLGLGANAQKLKEDLQSIFFFRPVEGVVSSKFNPREQHYGVDVVAGKDEPIKSVADGSVILASWTQDAGYVIGVQHKNQLVSFYKHNADLYKRVGDRVKAGDIIAVIGNSGEQTEGPHLHFELWYDGQPVDPLAFIMFE